LPVVLLVASVTGLIWAGLLLLRWRGQPVGKVPFGAFLAFAGWIMWLVEQAGGPVV
jgi:prepilin signal peptidase PulO-like enzyme (type II secretory pathway)